MAKLLYYIFVGILVIWVATNIPDVDFKGDYQSLAIAGAILGVINFAIKPVLKIITYPLRVITFGLFSLVLNMAILWTVDVLFLDKIFNLWTLFLATIIISILNLFLIRK